MQVKQGCFTAQTGMFALQIFMRLCESNKKDLPANWQVFYFLCVNIDQNQAATSSRCRISGWLMGWLTAGRNL